jgi:hypothetical protein
MSKRRDSSTPIYPVLPSSSDLWFLRVSGAGLGNCFYTYFQAVAMAEKHGAPVITPAWFSLKLGPLLRRERSTRFYWRMFNPFPGEIHGLRKFLTLLRSYLERATVEVGESPDPALVRGRVNFIVSRKFTFRGLHEHRAAIRERMLGIVNDPVPATHAWGRGGYIAVHVRLGDFAVASNDAVTSGKTTSLRIPVSWYVSLTRALRERHPEMPVYVFSDGDEQSLQPILQLGAELHRTSSDIGDLLAMSGASILVGSNSTFSWWAAFLGDMPSIWLRTDLAQEKPSAPETPILYVPLDCTEPALWD